jgi:hypothetical protein
MADGDQIQGLPPGAIVKPLGLPPGAIVRSADPLKTGKGMMENAQGQAAARIASGIPDPQNLKEETLHYSQRVTPGLKYDASVPLQTTEEVGREIKTPLVMGASMVAPEFAPEAGLLGSSALSGIGAGAGTMAAQGVTGNNPFSPENLKESGKNAAMYGGGSLVLGGAANILGQGFGKTAANMLRNTEGDITVTPHSILDRIVPERAPTPEWETPSPTRDELYNERGEDLMRRGRQQDALDRQAARPAKIGRELDQFGYPASENPAGMFAKVPNTMPKVGASSVTSQLGEGVEGSIAKPGGRMVLTPSEASAEELRYQQNKIGAHRQGMAYAAGARPPARVPRSPLPTETVEYPQARAQVRWNPEKESWEEAPQ